MSGWIRIYRDIQNHWIWNDPIKLKWWLDLLLLVNHSDNKINIGMDLIECKRGQTVMSLKSFGDRWNVSKDTARNFLKLLSKDNMITIENMKKTTRITIYNYDSYQSDEHGEQTQGKRKANARQTQADPNNNDKEEKRIKEDIFNFKKSLIDLGIEKQIVSDWLKVRSKKKSSNTETAFKTIKSEIEKSNLPANECIKKAVANSWAGFKNEWISNSNYGTAKKNNGEIRPEAENHYRPSDESEARIRRI